MHSAEYIEQLSVEIARYCIAHRCTVRQAASRFGVCKSTIHRYLRVILPNVDRQLYNEVSAVLDANLKDRHHRGGAATRRKFAQHSEVTSC